MELLKRPRRLRGSELVRRMVRETRMDAASLIYPMFVMDGVNRVDEISSLPHPPGGSRCTQCHVFRNTGT